MFSISINTSAWALLALASLPLASTQHNGWPQPYAQRNPTTFGSYSAADWPPSNVGGPLIPQTPDAELRAMLAEVDPVRIQTIVKTLADFGTRHTLSSQTDPKRGIGAARDWIAAQMNAIAATSNGNMAVTVPSYVQGIAARISFPVRISNIVARINGTSDPNRVYVVTGCARYNLSMQSLRDLISTAELPLTIAGCSHYDSRRIDIMDYTGDAPGADDDATGVAVVMELARICANKRPAATMIFAATAGEEQNLYGSTFLAQTLKNASANVEANFNNDIVGTGHYDPFYPINNYTIRLFGAGIYPTLESDATILFRVGIGGENDTPARALGRYVAEIAAGAQDAAHMQVALVYRADRFLRGGDHESFLEAGFPAVRFTEPNENFAHQHQDPRIQDGVVYGDNIEFVDFNFVARVAQVNLASMWAIANAPRMPRNVTINTAVGEPALNRTAVISTDSQLEWNVSNEVGLGGYEIVWRPTTAPQWTHSVPVGNVNTVTLKLTKDNVIFGVRAVGTNGKKSPAVFPFAI